MELCSPPKPTRVVNCLIQNVVDEAVDKVTARNESSGKHVEQANTCTEELLSLPALAGEVAVAQKQQISDLCKKQEILDQLKENYLKVQRKIEGVRTDLAATSRRVYLTEDDVARKKRSCESLEKDIAGLILSEQLLTKQIRTEKDKLQRGRDTYRQYHEKMAAHGEKVQLYELSGPIHQQIVKQKERNTEMKEELECLRGNGDTFNLTVIQAEMSHAIDETKRLETLIVSRQSELQKESERQTQLKRDIETLHKRNKAQLTRLKRQLQEAASRNRRWNDEACQLEEKIAQLRGMMDN